MICDAHSGKKSKDPDAKSMSSGKKCGQVVVSGFSKLLKPLLPPSPASISPEGRLGHSFVDLSSRQYN